MTTIGSPSVPDPADVAADDTTARMAQAWRELRRGPSTMMVRDRLFGTGADHVEPAQMDVLDLLVQCEDWRMGDLAAALRVDPSTITRMLQRLEVGGLAQRSSGGLDGRAVTVRLTAEGRHRQALVAARRTTIVGHLLGQFDEPDRRQLVELLERFIAAVDAYADTATAPNGPAGAH